MVNVAGTKECFQIAVAANAKLALYKTPPNQLNLILRHNRVRLIDFHCFTGWQKSNTKQSDKSILEKQKSILTDKIYQENLQNQQETRDHKSCIVYLVLFHRCGFVVCGLPGLMRVDPNLCLVRHFIWWITLRPAVLSTARLGRVCLITGDPSDIGEPSPRL